MRMTEDGRVIITWDGKEYISVIEEDIPKKVRGKLEDKKVQYENGDEPHTTTYSAKSKGYLLLEMTSSIGEHTRDFYQKYEEVVKPKVKSKKAIARIMRLHKEDGTHVDLNIVKATAIRSGAGMLHLDRIGEDFRLIVSDDIIDDMTNFSSLEMIRIDEDE